MVHFTSTAALSIVVLALGASGAPNNNGSSGLVITYDDVVNSQPVVPPVTDPTKKVLSGDPQNNSTLLQIQPDLATIVNDANSATPSLVADDKVPKPKGKTSRRDLSKRANVCETCELFTNTDPNFPDIQASPKALTRAAEAACQAWFPGPGIYFVPEGSSQTANYGHLTLEYGVYKTTCKNCNPPIPTYHTVSQAICIAEFKHLISLIRRACAGDSSGISSEQCPCAPIWYRWYTS